MTTKATTKAKAEKRLTKAMLRKSKQLHDRFYAGEFAIPHRRWMEFEAFAVLLDAETDGFIHYHAPNAHPKSDYIEGQSAFTEEPTEREIHEAHLYVNTRCDDNYPDSRRGLFRGLREVMAAELARFQQAVDAIDRIQAGWNEPTDPPQYVVWNAATESDLFTTTDRQEAWEWARKHPDELRGIRWDVLVSWRGVRFDDRFNDTLDWAI